MAPALEARSLNLLTSREIPASLRLSNLLEFHACMCMGFFCRVSEQTGAAPSHPRRRIY